MEVEALFGDVAVADVTGEDHRPEKFDGRQDLRSRRQRVAAEGPSQWGREVITLGVEFVDDLCENFVNLADAVIVGEPVENLDLFHCDGLRRLQHTVGRI